MGGIVSCPLLPFNRCDRSTATSIACISDSRGWWPWVYHDIGALLRQTGQGNGPDRGVSLSTFRFASRSDEPETAKKKIVKMGFFLFCKNNVFECCIIPYSCFAWLQWRFSPFAGGILLCRPNSSLIDWMNRGLRSAVRAPCSSRLSCPPMYCTASNSRSIPFAFHLLFLLLRKMTIKSR